MSRSDESTAVQRRFVSSPLGQIHVAESGQGEPVLFLHETPRSWDQFRDVLPIVGRERRALAMDTLGFGDSCPPRGDEAEIEAYAEGVVHLLDALGFGQVDLVGHHTGGVVAIETATIVPGRVRKLVLSSTPLVSEGRADEHGEIGVDEAEQAHDGSHLQELWEQRSPFYPVEGKADLLDRFMIDAVKAGKHTLGGHEAVAAYGMEPKLELITAPIYVILGGADQHALGPGMELAERVGPVTTEVIEGATVPMPEQKPEEFAAAVLRALRA